MKIISRYEALPKRPLIITIYGHPGIGKTSLSYTMPNPILFDFDGGMERAFQALRPLTIKVDKAEEFVNYVEGREFERLIKSERLQTVIIDTVGSLLDDYLTPYLIRQDPKNGTRTGGLSLSGWGQLSTTFNNLRNRFRELGLNMLAVCHAKDEGDESGVQARLAVKGGSADILYRVSDLIGYVYPEGQRRWVDFNPTAQHVGKNITGQPAYMIPDVNSTEYSEFLAGVIEDCYTAMNMRAIEQKNAIDEIQSWRERLMAAKSIEEVQALADELKGAGLSKTILVQVRYIFRRYLADHGLEFDKDGKLKTTKA